MKAEDFKQFFSDGRFGGKVMVQLKEAGTFTAFVDERKELTLATQFGIDRETVMKLAAELGRMPTDDEMKQLPKTQAVVPPVPVLVGELEALSGEVLLLKYNGAGNRRFLVTLNVNDIKHMTVPESTHIHVP